MLKGALIFAQSGGPTAVINASACGVFQEAQKHDCITNIYAAKYGIDGVLNEDFIDINKVASKEIDLLRFTPASAFGSCRHKLPSIESNGYEYQRLLEVFKKYNVRFFIYNGGNDSMDTCNKIAKFMLEHNYECHVIGVPKTIDNDLLSTDHCPGFASAAKYVATTCHEIALDTAVYQKGRVTIVEIMGRDAGWLTASSALATKHGAGPDLIYLPERNFDIDAFAKKCNQVLEERGHCLVALSEGIRNSDGWYISALALNNAADSFHHLQLGGAANFLAIRLTNAYGIKTRAVELSLSQRCAGHLTSKTDTDEAYLAGAKAVQTAVNGLTNRMVVFNRLSNNPYELEITTADLDGIANAVKHMPDYFINEEGDFVTDAFIDYVNPLIQGENEILYENGLPRYSKINPHFSVK
ncbi:MAG: 6-phosphofructokinase [Corallococcus sp.]|nr:6-phosphofructokinase [Corallococcus sp.]